MYVLRISSINTVHIEIFLYQNKQNTNSCVSMSRAGILDTKLTGMRVCVCVCIPFIIAGVCDVCVCVSHL